MLVAASLLASILGATTASADTSVSIVDAPLPIANWGYTPRTVQVMPGEWVVWSNSGGDAHSVTAVDQSFDSAEVAPSEGFSWFFDQPGTYDYYCTFHDWMKGQVVVGDGAPPAPPDETPPEA